MRPRAPKRRPDDGDSFRLDPLPPPPPARIEDLKSFGELQDRATELTRETLAEIGEKNAAADATSTTIVRNASG